MIIHLHPTSKQCLYLWKIFSPMRKSEISYQFIFFRWLFPLSKMYVYLYTYYINRRNVTSENEWKSLSVVCSGMYHSNTLLHELVVIFSDYEFSSNIHPMGTFQICVQYIKTFKTCSTKCHLGAFGCITFGIEFFLIYLQIWMLHQ